MHIQNWKKEILTVPNLLTLFRLILLPVYAAIYLSATTSLDYLLAGGVMAVSCTSDLFDGMVARRFHQITTLGKILDPLADKITQCTLTLCLSFRYPLLWPLFGLFLIKELFQLVVGVCFLLKKKILPGALMAGKVCTTVLFISLIGLVTFPDMPRSMVMIIAVTDSAFLTISFVCYIFAYFGRNAKIERMDTGE